MVLKSNNACLYIFHFLSHHLPYRLSPSDNKSVTKQKTVCEGEIPEFTPHKPNLKN